MSECFYFPAGFGYMLVGVTGNFSADDEDPYDVGDPCDEWEGGDGVG